MPAQSAKNESDGLSIRPATNADITAIRAVLFSVRREYGVLGEMLANDPDLDDIEANYLRRRGWFEVVEDGSCCIVGCAGLLPLDERRAELCKMYLHKSARGRGVGKTLLRNILEAARRNGFAEVWVETNSVLTEAIGLYVSHGFKPVDAHGLLPKCDQAYLLRLDEPVESRDARTASRTQGR